MKKNNLGTVPFSCLIFSVLMLINAINISLEKISFHENYNGYIYGLSLSLFLLSIFLFKFEENISFKTLQFYFLFIFGLFIFYMEKLYNYFGSTNCWYFSCILLWLTWSNLIEGSEYEKS